MITPSANLLPYLTAKNSTPIWYVKISKSEGVTGPDSAASYWPFTTGSGGGFWFRYFTTGTVSWSTRSTLLADYALHESRLDIDSLRDLVFKIPGADEAVGGISAVDTFEVRLDNTDGALAGRSRATAFKANHASSFVDVAFGGRKVEVYLTFSGLTSEADSLLRFTGEVDDAFISGDKLVLRCVSKIQAFDALVPPNLFENTVEGFTKGADGQAVPLVFGAVKRAPGFLTKYVSDTGSADTGPVVKFADVSELAIDDFSIVVYGASGLAEVGGYASFCTGTRPNLSFYTPYGENVADGEIYFSNPDIEKLELEIECKPDGYANNFAASYATAVDPENVLDDDDATYSRLTWAVISGYRILALKLPSISLSGDVHRDEATGYTGVFLRIHANIQLNVDVNGRFRAYFASTKDGWLTFADYIQIPELDYTDNGVVNNMAGYGYQMSEGATVTWSEFGTLSALSARFLKLQVFNPYVDVYNLRVAIGFSIDLPTEGYFADMTGYVDTSPSAVTGTASLLIENPAHILIALYGFWGANASTADTNVSALRALAAGARAGWIFGRSLVDQQKISKYAEELGQQAAIWVHLNNAGKIVATPWQAIAGEDPAIRLTPWILEDAELDDFGQSRARNVLSDISVKYGFNPVRDEFDGLVYCNPSASSPELGAAWEDLCSWAAFDNGGTPNDEVFECPWIEDRATAVELAKILVKFHTPQRWWIQFTLDLAGIGLEVGDRVDFLAEAEADWPISYPPEMLRANYRITEIRIRPGTDRVTIKASEVYE